MTSDLSLKHCRICSRGSLLVKSPFIPKRVWLCTTGIPHTFAFDRLNRQRDGGTWEHFRICAREARDTVKFAVRSLLVNTHMNIISNLCSPASGAIWGVFLYVFWRRSQKVPGIRTSFNHLNEAISCSIGVTVTLDRSRYCKTCKIKDSSTSGRKNLICLITLEDIVACTANIHGHLSLPVNLI